MTERWRLAPSGRRVRTLEWNIITRTIVPVISQPLSGDDRTNGIGDAVFTAHQMIHRRGFHA